jgi:predicted metal-dependent HD superfamily phosphohydrolase
MPGVARIISGGQSGVDRAALDVALRLGIPYVRDSDATLVVAGDGAASAGTTLTIETAERLGRPVLVVTPEDTVAAREPVAGWVRRGRGAASGIVGAMNDLPWPLPERTDLRDRLVAAYSSGRGYHDLTHLAEVLDRIAELGGAGNRELVLAAWFHDAVYEGARDDEERSAALAAAELEDTTVDVAEVVRLVLVTALHAPDEGDRAGEVLSDADLGVLAAVPARYADYVAGVREDYAHLSDEEFRAGRLLVLEDLAARPRLFRTDHAHAQWDGAARTNLAAEIAELRARQDQVRG